MKRCKHNWVARDPRHWDGTVLQQCTKCTTVRNTSGWVPWVVAAAVLAGLAYYFFG